MARIITMRYSDEGRLPDATEEQLEDLQANVVETVEQYDDVEFKGTFADENGMGICEWEAPDVETVEEIYVESGAVSVAPSDEIIEVEQILPL
ncbi:MAG: nickel-binding protein [Halodesulfurarchaeum sp.]